MSESARMVIEVTAGVIPGQPEQEHSKSWSISTSQWEAAAKEGPEAVGALLATFSGAAQGYAGLLMLQPDRLNWVRTDWVYF